MGTEAGGGHLQEACAPLNGPRSANTSLPKTVFAQCVQVTPTCGKDSTWFNADVNYIKTLLKLQPKQNKLQFMQTFSAPFSTLFLPLKKAYMNAGE